MAFKYGMYIEPAAEQLRLIAEDLTRAASHRQSLGPDDVMDLINLLVGVHKGLYGTWQLICGDYDYYGYAAKGDPRAAMFSALTSIREPGGSLVHGLVDSSFARETIRATAKQAGTQNASRLLRRGNTSKSGRRGRTGGSRGSAPGTGPFGDSNVDGNKRNRPDKTALTGKEGSAGPRK